MNGRDGNWATSVIFGRTGDGRFFQKRILCRTPTSLDSLANCVQKILNMSGTKAFLTQSDVQKILNASDKYAAENNFNVTIAVTDEGGHLLGLIRRDGCAPVAAYIAQEKAKTSAMGRRESRIYEEMINNGRNAFLSVPHLSGLLEGGINIEVNGSTIGAVGVSGVKPAEDAAVARAGIAALSSA